VVAMNATFVGPADLGPRAHPNAGLLDITDGSLPRSDRRAADRRELTGTHVPHPDLTERRTASYDVHSDDELGLWVDGRPIGSSRRFEIRCVPDACVVVA
jgi:diacylglycerol kinase family enzyme